jgi:hypothetical protein
VRELRVLITNMSLATRSGTETYVRDLAIGLVRRGHTPIVYSTYLGEPAVELRAATVMVVDNLRAIAAPPDVIHGHHHPETVTALLYFPAAPAVFCCHDRMSVRDTPPRSERILRYVAVDDTCRDRLVYEEGIPEDRVAVLRNGVDLERFRARPPLPPRPRRALVFSHYASEHTYLPVVRTACERAGVSLDVIGMASGNPSARPEEALGQYDLVFAKARCALEALAVGAAVVLCGRGGAGPMVTAADFERLRRLNFGMRTLTQPLCPEALLREITRYDPKDAADVSCLVRATCGVEHTVDAAVALYHEVLAEHRSRAPVDPLAERRAAADYLRRLTSVEELCVFEKKAARAEAAVAELKAERDHWREQFEQVLREREQVRERWTELQAEYERSRAAYEERCRHLETEVARLRRSPLRRLRERARRIPLLGGAFRRSA